MDCSNNEYSFYRFRRHFGNGRYRRLSSIELGIAFSVLVFGLVIASSARVYISLIYVFVAIFAIFHGYANGLEITQLATSWSYVVWFMIGTVFLFHYFLFKFFYKNIFI